VIRAFTGERHLRGRWLPSPRRPGDPHQAGDAKGSRRAVGVQAVRLIQAMTRHPTLSDHEHMRTSRDQRGPGRTDAPAAMMLDDVVDHYVDWRGSARAVEDAYARWSFASGPERILRFAAYTATLDQEQKTAAAYAEAVTDVERWLQRSESHRAL
jgi:hypothetical protein